ncbi:STAS domain-containing protein [Aquabacter spiritensis]|uniref:Anti-sigma factor antagonist n=1 Tax=Aquabacter spiritensis TaxID=933073 RepID=A0A4V2UYM6_9HYPH|nr:STAS domain-containing protein [Aquabacter spiritensis]TCT07998.1 anti-sigma B factor antagonist [Aquabacter spiritensis]
MQIEREATGSDLVLKVSGRLDTPNAKPFEQSLLAAVAETSGRITVDLAGVDYVSSSGLRALLVAGKAMRAAKRELALRALQPQIREVFDISGFSTLFEIT